MKKINIILMLFLVNNIRFSVIIANSQEILKSFAIPIALVYVTNLAFNAYAVKYQNIKSIEKEKFLNKLQKSIKGMNKIEHVKGMNKIEHVKNMNKIEQLFFKKLVKYDSHVVIDHEFILMIGNSFGCSIKHDLGTHYGFDLLSIETCLSVDEKDDFEKFLKNNNFLECMDINIQKNEDKKIVVMQPNYFRLSQGLSAAEMKEAEEKNNKINDNLQKNAMILLLLYDINMFLKKIKSICNFFEISLKNIFNETKKKLLEGEFKLEGEFELDQADEFKFTEENQKKLLEGEFGEKFLKKLLNFRKNFFENLMEKDILKKSYALLMKKVYDPSCDKISFINKLYLVINGDLIKSFNKAYEKKICNNMLECLNPLNWWDKNNTLYILITYINFCASIAYGVINRVDDSINTLECCLCFMYLNFLIRVCRVVIPQLNSVNI